MKEIPYWLLSPYSWPYFKFLEVQRSIADISAEIRGILHFFSSERYRGVAPVCNLYILSNYCNFLYKCLTFVNFEVWVYNVFGELFLHISPLHVSSCLINYTYQNSLSQSLFTSAVKNTCFSTFYCSFCWMSCFSIHSSKRSFTLY